MRKLMWFTIGFAVAAALCAYIVLGMAALYIALIAFALYAGLFLLKKTPYAIVTVVLLGFAVGMFYCWGYDGIMLSPAKQCHGESQWIKLEATDYSFETGYGIAVDGKIGLKGRSYKARLYLNEYSKVEPGDVLMGRTVLSCSAPDSLDTATYHRGEGIFLLARSEGAMKLQRVQGLSARYFAAWLRKSIGDLIKTAFPSDTAAFASALLLGDDSGIGFADDISLQKSGIRHVIAVSGLHVSILFSMVYFVSGKRRLLALVAGIPVLAIFAAVAGFTPSVVRACIMQGLMILAATVDREYDPATALSFAAITMLAQNPLVITSASFQMSVGCMIGIFLFSQKIRDYLYNEKRLGAAKGKGIKARLKRWFVGSVSVSVSAMLVTLPLCAVYFGRISVIGIISNLLLLWLITILFYGIIVVCVLAAISLPVGTFLALILSLPIRLVLVVSRLLADLPFAVAYAGSWYTVIWIFGAYCLVAVFFLCKNGKPLQLAAGIAALYFIALFLTWVEPKTDHFRLTAVDVGQGQCILLQCKDEAYMIDCGGDDPELTADAALLALGANGVSRLDGLILTHYDTDHANGAVYLAQSFPIDTLYLPDTEPADDIRRQLTQLDTPIQWVENNITLDCGAGELSLFPAESELQGNESSMCILFQTENCDILITGDRNWEGEYRLLQQGGIPDIEILVVGHHGAGTSTSLELLKRTKPETVIISVGTDNPYGHPDLRTLHWLSRAGCIVRRTDMEGNITIRG